MSAAAKLKHELRSVGLYTLFFAAWFAMFMLLKSLVLAEYNIRFSGLSAVVVASLVLAKVVLLLEHVSLGAWMRERPAWVDVVVRTVVYSIGVLLVLLIEKGFEVRHDQDGLLESLARLVRHEDIHHVLANTICAAGALLVFNTLAVLQKRLGAGELFRVFREPLPAEPASGNSTPAGVTPTAR
jgi:hypothetical protein